MVPYFVLLCILILAFLSGSLSTFVGVSIFVNRSFQITILKATLDMIKRVNRKLHVWLTFKLLTLLQLSLNTL